MKLRAAVTVLGKGTCDAQLETPTVEGAVGPNEGRRVASVCGMMHVVVGREVGGARKQSQLTIFCDATGAGSSLYLRALSGIFGCDIVIIARW
jgi:hypothetical protein